MKVNRDGTSGDQQQNSYESWKWKVEFWWKIQGMKTSIYGKKMINILNGRWIYNGETILLMMCKHNELKYVCISIKKYPHDQNITD